MMFFDAHNSFTLGRENRAGSSSRASVSAAGKSGNFDAKKNLKFLRKNQFFHLRGLAQAF
jgi:hypothetical protein